MSDSVKTLAAPAAQKQGYWRLVGRQFLKNRKAVVALAVLILLGFAAVFAPFLAEDKPIYLVMDNHRYWLPNVFTYSELVSVDFARWTPAPNDYAIFPLLRIAPDRSNLRNRLTGPTKANPLGTDDRGRDVLSRIIWGTRVSMSVGFVAVGISVLIGVILGCLAGYYRGVVDTITLRVIEIIMCFPSLIIILTLVALLPPSIYNIMIVLGILGWTGVARLVRGEFLRLRESDFAVAATATGLSDARVIFRHLLPNALSPVLVTATFGVAGAILTESALSFLGLGVPPPMASWGEILAQSKNYLDRAWWLVVYPGAAIFVTVTAFNLVGEALRDAMDPRLRQ